MKPEELTIVVPTKNEAANIRRFLDSIPPAVKLIVVDASRDETPQIILEHRPANTLIISSQERISAARQLGIDAADTPWVIVTDADVCFAPDYFQRLEPQVCTDVVYGAKLSADQYQGYHRWFTIGQKLFHQLGIPAASGSNLVLRKSALMQAGGFDKELLVNEDSEVVWRVKRAGFKVTFDENLIVYSHDHRRLQRGTWRKTLHSLVRCFLLYFNLLPAKWRSHDWGYWSSK